MGCHDLSIWATYAVLFWKAFVLFPAFRVERILCQWLPWYRRFIATAVFSATFALALFHHDTAPGSAIGMVLLYWNMWTGLRNMRQNKPGKPFPAIGAALTAIQQSAFYRQAHDAR